MFHVYLTVNWIGMNWPGGPALKSLELHLSQTYHHLWHQELLFCDALLTHLRRCVTI